MKVSAPISKKLNQSGIAPILFLIAALGVIAFVLISSTAPFRDRLFSKLFPKPSSFAAEHDEIIVKFKLEVPDKEKEVILNTFNLKTEKVIDSKDEVEVIENTSESSVSAGESVQGISTTSQVSVNAAGEKKFKKKLTIEKTRVQAGDRDKIISELSKNPNVEYAEPNYIGHLLFIPNDPKYSTEWDLPLVQSPGGWDITQGSSSVIVAFIDSGVNSAHEDLVGKIVTGFDVYNNNTNTTDNNGHGTFVAGRISATHNNSKGIASLGGNTRIMSVKDTIDSTDTYSSFYLAHGIIWAADNGAKVISISQGADYPSISIQNAIDYAWGKGIIIVAAAGNNSGCCIIYPAAGNHVIAVGSLNSSGKKASASSIGLELDVMAGGAGVTSTTRNGSYGTGNGTSFSAPQVAALAALILSVKPDLNPAQITDIIIQTADDMDTAGFDTNTGWGRINVLKALQKAQITNPEPLVDTENPKVSISSPGNNAYIKGTKTITASATDVGIGVARVEFYIDDGNPISTVSSAPYSYSWNTRSVSDGSHSIFAKAYDGVGNSVVSSAVNVTIDNTLPTVSITSPTGGSTVSGVVPINADASDANLKKVNFIIDGTVKLGDTNSPYTYSWDTTSLANGTSHTIIARAFDKADNSKDASITVTVNNTATPFATPTP